MPSHPATPSEVHANLATNRISHFHKENPGCGASNSGTAPGHTRVEPLPVREPTAFPRTDRRP
ncbi:hypothetical protein C8E97_0510 [Saccharothrix australiensis]|uniref:Uncharacterized protein n=1 Tax=Saccharothrix australiensis TaxID=2072 RepID=A0A495VRL7_9PSEU|nr:hypothetical protein C8E97_0510 [Saccharothrix australiensis]